MTSLINNYWCVPVPEEGNNFKISPTGWLVGYKTLEKLPFPCEIVGLSDQITEEQAQKIFPNPPYAKHEPQNILDENYSGLWVQTALESFQSLMRSKNLMGRYAVIKKIDNV